MAEEQPQNRNPETHNSFTGGLYKDSIDIYSKEGYYIHARNAVNNLPDGQVGCISTEPSNLHCCNLPFTLIGAIPLDTDQWMVFTTDDTHSEIGIFQESQCTYSTLVNDPCLNFNRKNLISGASRRGFDCGYNVYWSDGARNPDRYINTVNVPWVQTCTPGPCVRCTNTTQLDCDKLRIAPLFIIPCLQLAKSQGSGQLLNGTYQIAIRYSIIYYREYMDSWRNWRSIKTNSIRNRH